MSEKCLNVSHHSTFLGSWSTFLLIIHVYLYKCNTKKSVKLICLNYTKLENIHFDGNGWRCLQVSVEFFLYVSLNSADSVTKIFVITVKKLKTATSCVRDQDATTAPARHMWDTRSLNWTQFMLQWFIRFPGFAEFNESSTPFRKNSIELGVVKNQICRMLSWVSIVHKSPGTRVYTMGFSL